MKKHITKSEPNILNLDLDHISLIIANVIPVIGLIFLKWSLFSILILFWLETAIIGFFNIFKIILAQGKKGYENSKIDIGLAQNLSKIFMVPFFMFHFGGFMIGHLVFILVIGLGFLEKSSFQLNNIFSIIIQIFFSLIFLFISHGISFFKNYIGKKEYEKLSPTELFVAPYSRVVVMHITIIFGTMLIGITNLPATAGIFLIAIKIYFDLKAHIKEHQTK